MFLNAIFDWILTIIIHQPGADVPMPYAASLEVAALPQIRDVVAAVKSVLKVKWEQFFAKDQSGG